MGATVCYLSLENMYLRGDDVVEALGWVEKEGRN
jgi:hypothetical protein